MAPEQGTKERIVVIGAGMGGLAAAIRLAAQGQAVTLVEALATPGGKMRAIPSSAGPIDAGPTVLTMRQVFDDLFALAGERLEDHLILLPQTVLARHWWPEGGPLDLTGDTETDAQAIAAFAGADEALAFRRFDRLATTLHRAFDAPVMQAPKPRLGAILAATLSQPALWPALLPGLSLSTCLLYTSPSPRD